MIVRQGIEAWVEDAAFAVLGRILLIVSAPSVDSTCVEATRMLAS